MKEALLVYWLLSFVNKILQNFTLNADVSDRTFSTILLKRKFYLNKLLLKKKKKICIVFFCQSIFIN